MISEDLSISIYCFFVRAEPSTRIVDAFSHNCLYLLQDQKKKTNFAHKSDQCDEIVYFFGIFFFCFSMLLDDVESVLTTLFNVSICLVYLMHFGKEVSYHTQYIYIFENRLVISDDIHEDNSTTRFFRNGFFF